ncbi:hypothetical protein apy_16570 [Aeropyrum pernix]|uniref:Uncharacterized protein n=2 Tax=Aeropyrum pernix TaxID=56636 RepID=A0A401HC37_AERPX|nr:hypothetical protein apy_16570 [Aeropyrum pernix]
MIRLSNKISTVLIVVGLAIIGGLAYSYTIAGKEGNAIPKSDIPESDIEAGIDLQLLNKWGFIVVERNSDVVSKNLQKILTYKNINVSVTRYGSVAKLAGGELRKPSIVILNLLDKEVLKEINSSARNIDVLRELARGGNYILFVADESGAIHSISDLFNPPLSYPSESKVTITKQYKDGRTEIILQDLLIVVGRTYRNIDGRLVPINFMSTVHIDDFNNMDDAIQEALLNILTLIIQAESDSASKR